jgi:hypothetical protein
MRLSNEKPNEAKTEFYWQQIHQATKKGLISTVAAVGIAYTTDNYLKNRFLKHAGAAAFVGCITYSWYQGKRIDACRKRLGLPGSPD